ncbi:MAG: FkbM family methyltransferase [Opitutaceae bacterium]|nr:FkbM family methyltransferase [Opitutaceae bacterium]
MNASMEPPAVGHARAGSPEGTTIFRIGGETMPFLADHGFQGMIVLPGAFYLELALRVLDDARRSSVVGITDMKFLQPLILSDKPIDVAVDRTRQDEKRARFSFREADTRSAGDQPCATLEIDCGASDEVGSIRSTFAPEIFQQTAEQSIDKKEFYRRLQENGNQYGPRFQGLRQLWRSGHEVLARLSVPQTTDTPKESSLDPIAVDAAIQSLMVFGLDRGRTLVLRTIDAVLLRRPAVFTDGWVTARLTSENRDAAENLVGDIEVRDDSGACWLELRGVTLTSLDPVNAAQAMPGSTTNIVVAATFTVEPITDVFRFWSDTLGLHTRLGFAPYGQVFQQLLDPDSEFRRNRDGCNVILLNLADWAAERPSTSMHLDSAKAAVSFRDLDHCTLPNGLEVAQLNRHETEYVYREIFQDRCYLRHGIRLPEAGTVIDIGANIGLFSLFVRSETPGATVLAYEPSPAAFRALKANCEAYGPGLHPFNCGVSERRGHASLTCYEKSSVFSTFHANQQEDREAIRAVAMNVARDQWQGDAEPVAGLIDELLADRLDSRIVSCPVVSVSDIIRENNVRRVDLLKIDAEKCELEILRGIEGGHWPLIEQVVVEVHDRTRALLDQVQEILVQHGFHCAVAEENLLTGSGLFNVYAMRERADAADRAVENGAEKFAREIQRTADEFVDALSAFTRQTTSQTLLAVVPCEANTSGTDRGPTFARIEGELLRRVRELPRVHALGSQEMLARYPALDFFQGDARQLGHIPYTADGFAAIGTSLFRVLAALRRRPFKVIALDCDHTLWQGACGEDGPLGVVVTPAHRALQEFMVRQMEAGMILCLCSKNQEADVWSVFAGNPGMALKRGHLAAARINWSPKSDSVRSLAAELNVGLDSFILLDDNPTECAEVRANCREVLVLPLPTVPEIIPHFLDHVWAFDHFTLTAEDRARTQMLANSGQREKYRAQAPTLESFIAGLELKVAIFTPEARQLERVAQLTQRTNQFNFSTIRRSESELARFLENKTHHCLAVHVSDRFGDYGLVGALLYVVAEDCYRVDTVLMSCRVLGRGVEHQVLAELGRRALSDGKSRIELVFRPTERNQPAKDFLASLGTRCASAENAEMTFRFTATHMAEVRYGHPAVSDDGTRSAENKNGVANLPPRRDSSAASRRFSKKFEPAAGELDDAHKIAGAVEAHRLRAAGFTAMMAGRDLSDTLSGKLLGLWRKILGNPHVGIDDKFIEVGGTSLAAVQVVAAVRKELQLPLSVAGFFECPTVRLLSEKLAPTEKKDVAADEAMARGTRRKQRLGRRGEPAGASRAPREVA